jgi:hypothetical protein
VADWTALCGGQGTTDRECLNCGDQREVMRTDRPERRVLPRAVVEPLDRFEPIIAPFLTRGIVTQRCALPLHAPKEPFHDRMMRALTLAPHSAAKVTGRDDLLVGTTGVLITPILVRPQARGGTTTPASGITRHALSRPIGQDPAWSW